MDLIKQAENLAPLAPEAARELLCETVQRPASDGYLSNPIQRAQRDISIATNHRIFSKTKR